jgi:hypothetical protein
MPDTARIAAARTYAPPLVVVEAFDKRGARLRQVNPKAIGYAQRAGLKIEDVYPGALGFLRSIAPPQGTVEATRFVQSIGVPANDIYPTASISGEASPRRRRRWLWVAAGLVLGVVTGGVSGAVAGGVVGAIVGAR